MKKFLIVVALLTGIQMGNLNAQTREDAVYLKDGSVFRGKVTENISGVKTTIETEGRNTFVLPDSLIKMILFDQVIPQKERVNNASPVEMAASVNFYGGSENSGGFTFITSYHFPFRLSTGVGVGIEWFDRQQIPFMADVKYYFLKGSWSPCLYAQGGYAVPLSKNDEQSYQEYYGGMLAGAGAGMRFNFNKRNALVFNFGYRYQKTKTLSGYYGWLSSYPQYETERYDTYNRLTFSFGFLFN
jgi:hypothetical protein